MDNYLRIFRLLRALSRKYIVANGGMHPSPVVVELDVLEDAPSRLVPHPVALSFHQLSFQRLEERLRHRDAYAEFDLGLLNITFSIVITKNLRISPRERHANQTVGQPWSLLR